MIVLGSLDESYDNVFSTFTERILSETVIMMDDARKLMLSHESRLEGRKAVTMSPLHSINFTVENTHASTGH